MRTNWAFAMGMIPLGGAALLLWSMTFPIGEATTEVTASITFEGQVFSGQSVWLTHAATQNGFPDSGWNWAMRVSGDAVVFDVGGGRYLFLNPSNGFARRCAVEETGEHNVALALQAFKGPCQPAKSGLLTYVETGPSAEPKFVRFAVDGKGELNNPGGGKQPLSSEVASMAQAEVRLVSLKLVRTSKPLGTDMTERFPWILQLPRTDEKGGYSRATARTYAQDFTTYLPAPVGGFEQTFRPE